MRKDATVIYYTSNQENESFEKKIRQKILNTIGDMPLISVSQKPIDFGKNICVGNVGLSGHNVFRQLQIGAEAATTPFIISAEADVLYPKEYFEFVPPELDACYRYDNVYILWQYYTRIRKFYFRKAHTEGAQICGREWLIKEIKRVLSARGIMWKREEEHRSNIPNNIYWKGFKFFHGEIPVVSIKTDKGLHGQQTGIIRSRKKTLPQWGDPDELRKELFT